MDEEERGGREGGQGSNDRGLLNPLLRDEKIKGADQQKKGRGRGGRDIEWGPLLRVTFINKRSRQALSRGKHISKKGS